MTGMFENLTSWVCHQLAKGYLEDTMFTGGVLPMSDSLPPQAKWFKQPRKSQTPSPAPTQAASQRTESAELIQLR